MLPDVLHWREWWEMLGGERPTSGLCPYLCTASALQCGGDDGTRTRGLCRDRAAF